MNSEDQSPLNQEARDAYKNWGQVPLGTQNQDNDYEENVVDSEEN